MTKSIECQVSPGLLNGCGDGQDGDHGIVTAGGGAMMELDDEHENGDMMNDHRLDERLCFSDKHHR